MATSLRDNLTSSYFNAAHKLYPKKARRRIIAYVESYDDKCSYYFYSLSVLSTSKHRCFAFKTPMFRFQNIYVSHLRLPSPVRKDSQDNDYPQGDIKIGEYSMHIIILTV